MNKIVIGVHAGHSKKGVGAGAYGYIAESTYNRKIAYYVREYLKNYGYSVRNTTVDTGTQKEVLQGIYRKSKGCDYNISIHLNAGRGTGFETLVKNSDSNVKKLNDKIVKDIKMKNRGIKGRNDLYVLNNLKNCILFECGFVDNIYDADTVMNNYKEIGKSIAKHYHEYIAERKEK